MKIDEVLLKPVLTEKATNLAKRKEYLFEVNLKANKHNIKQALEKLYKVKVKKVRAMVRKGKERRVGKKMANKTLPDRKIAYVILKEGKIDLFPQA